LFPYHTNSALYPLVGHWKRLAGWQPEDDGAARLAKLESALAPYRLPREEAVPLFASLLSLPLGDSYPRLDLTPEQLKEQTADTIVALSLEEPNGNRCSRSGKTCIGPTPRPWSCSAS
jgi:hypothetical protein